MSSDKVLFLLALGVFGLTLINGVVTGSWWYMIPGALVLYWAYKNMAYNTISTY